MFDPNLGLLILGIVVGAAIAGHGAQKVFGLSGGPGPTGTEKMMTASGLRPTKQCALLAS